MSFDALWGMYPRKVAKRVAQKSFERLTQAEQALALAVMPNHITYWKTQDTQLAYIPHLATWLNQYRFEDQIVIEPPKVNKRPSIRRFANDRIKGFLPHVEILLVILCKRGYCY